MVNKLVSGERSAAAPAAVGWLVCAYVLVALGTLAALAALAANAPSLATPHAWGHAVIVGVLAFVLALRARAALRGGGRAMWAVGVVAAVLLVANLAEAVLPGFVPTWMRFEMLFIAALMVPLCTVAVRSRRAG